jgi:trimeric autotransporter adhesin
MKWKQLTLALTLFFIWPITNCLATTHIWNGSTSSDWGTASNWSPASVPGSLDAVQIGLTLFSFTNSPTVASTTSAVCASIEFGVYGTITLTVNGTLAVSGNITQDHPTFAQNVTTSITGTGTIGCVNFTVGSNTGALSVSNTTTVKCNVAALNISGNLTSNSVTTVAIIGIGVFQNNAVFIITNDNSVNNTVTVTGQLVITNTNAATLLGFVSPFAAIDMYVTGSNVADLKLLNASAISIANSAYDLIDFYVPAGGSGSSTVEYGATSGTQTVYTNTTAGLDNSPATYQNITFSGSATKSIQSGSLLIYGNWSSASGMVDAMTNTPLVYFEGTAAETLTDAGSNSGAGVVFDNVYFQGGGTKTISSGTFSVADVGVLTMAGSTTLNANGGLTLISDGTSTATVAPVLSGCSISGNVNVQRFVFGSSTSLLKRGYRFVSSAVYTGTSTTPIQSNVYSITYLLNSTYLSGPSGGGFNAPNGTNPSSYIFREDMVPSNSSFTSGNWKGIEKINNSPVYNIGTQSRLNLTSTPDTTTVLPVGNGFIFYFVGNQSNNGTQSGTKTSPPFDYPENVTFTQTGSLNTGTINVRVWYRPNLNLSYTKLSGDTSERGLCLLGNPYAASINWEKFNRNGTNSTIYGANFASVTTNPTTIYMFNQSSKQYDVYQQKTGTVDTTSINPSSNRTGAATNIIASGQAFFLRSTNTNETISFRENAKTTSQPVITTTLDSVFNALPPTAKAQVPADVPNASLHFTLTKDSVNTDEIVVSFSNQGNVNLNPLDAEDLGGIGAQVSLSALSADSVKLAIHTVPLPLGTSSLSIPLFVAATSSGLYKLNLSSIANLPNNYQVWLMDNYNRDSLDIRSYNSYGFNIDLTNSASYGSNRFCVLIRENPAYVTKLLTFNATKADGSGVLTWAVNDTYDGPVFTVQRSTDNGATFTTLSTISTGSSNDYLYIDNDPAKAINLYRLQYTINGKQQFSNVIPLDFSANAALALTLYPNPTVNLINVKINNNQSNDYTIMLLNSSGSVINKSSVMDTSWQYNASSLLHGVYIISVYDNKEGIPVGTSKFIKE